MRVRAAVFRSILRQDVAWFDASSDHTAGALVNRLSNDCFLLQALTGERASIALSQAVVLVGGFALVMAGSVALLVVLLVQNGGNLDEVMTGPENFDMSDPWIFTIQNLMLASFIPLAGLTTWLVHQVRPGFVSSVIGRFRWGWTAWCLALLVPLWGGYVAVASLLLPSSAAGGGAGDGANRPEHWILLLVLMLLTTPLQAAGEEYLFRGWIMQQMGALFRHRWVALGISIVLSSVLFALAHMSLDPWVLLDLAGMATAMVLITWRTGGLEAAVVLHAVNNLVAIGYAILFGDLAGSFIEPETTSTWEATLVSWVAVAVATAALWWLARWRGVYRRVVPRGSAGPEAAVAAAGEPRVHP